MITAQTRKIIQDLRILRVRQQKFEFSVRKKQNKFDTKLRSLEKLLKLKSPRIKGASGGIVASGTGGKSRFYITVVYQELADSANFFVTPYGMKIESGGANFNAGVSATEATVNIPVTAEDFTITRIRANVTINTYSAANIILRDDGVSRITLAFGGTTGEKDSGAVSGAVAGGSRIAWQFTRSGSGAISFIAWAECEYDDVL